MAKGHPMRRKRSWTEEQLKVAVKTSTSIRQVLVKLKLRPAGGNYRQINKYITELNLSTVHFTGMAWNKGLHWVGKYIRSMESILVQESDYQSYKLKRRLINDSLKPGYCEECGWAKISAMGHLPLELHHINGDRKDNRIDNLKILCPNCHSLTANYRSRKRKK